MANTRRALCDNRVCFWEIGGKDKLFFFLILLLLLLFFFLLLLILAGSYVAKAVLGLCVDEDDFELLTLLSPPAEHWGYNHALPCLVYWVLEMEPMASCRLGTLRPELCSQPLCVFFLKIQIFSWACDTRL